MIQRQGHGCAVDWWGLGVVCFEVLHGRSPFALAPAQVGGEGAGPKAPISRAEVEISPVEIYRRITHPEFKVQYDASFSADALSLIKRLLRRKAEMRLGANGAQEVRPAPPCTAPARPSTERHGLAMAAVPHLWARLVHALARLARTFDTSRPHLACVGRCAPMHSSRRSSGVPWKSPTCWNWLDPTST